MVQTGAIKGKNFRRLDYRGRMAFHPICPVHIFRCGHCGETVVYLRERALGGDPYQIADIGAFRIRSSLRLAFAFFVVTFVLGFPAAALFGAGSVSYWVTLGIPMAIGMLFFQHSLHLYLDRRSAKAMRRLTAPIDKAILQVKREKVEELEREGADPVKCAQIKQNIRTAEKMIDE